MASALPALGQTVTYDSTGNNRICTVSGGNFGPTGIVLGESNSEPLFRFRVKSGWTVRIAGGNYVRVQITGVNGAPAGVRITNYNGQVNLSDEGFTFTDCRNVTLAGDLQGARAYNPANPADTTYLGFQIDHTSKYNFVLEGLRTNGNIDPPGGRRDGFSLSGANCGDITFKQCGVFNVSGAAFKDNQSTNKDSVQFIDCRVRGTIQEAIYSGPTSGTAIVANYVKVERCQISNTYRNAVQVVNVSGRIDFNRNYIKSAALAQMPGSGQAGGFAWNGYGTNFTVSVTNSVFEDVNGELIGGFMDTPVGNNTAHLGRYIIRNNLFRNVLSPAYFNNRAPGTGKRVTIKYENNTVIFGQPTQIYPNLIPLPGATPPYTPPTLAVPANTPAVFIETPTNAANTDTLVFANNIVVNANSSTLLNTRANTSSNGTDPETGLARRRDNIFQATEAGIGFAAPASVALPNNAVPPGRTYPDYRVSGLNAGRGAQLVGTSNMGWPASDLTPPFPPAQASFSNIAATSVTISTLGSPSSDVAGYVFTVNGTPLADVSASTTRIISGRQPGENIEVLVRAFDFAGNFSEQAGPSSVNLLPPVQTNIVKRGASVIEVTTPSGRVTSMHKSAFSFSYSLNVFTIFMPGQEPLYVQLQNLLPAQANITAAVLYLQGLIE